MIKLLLFSSVIFVLFKILNYKKVSYSKDKTLSFILLDPSKSFESIMSNELKNLQYLRENGLNVDKFADRRSDLLKVYHDRGRQEGWLVKI